MPLTEIRIVWSRLQGSIQTYPFIYDASVGTKFSEHEKLPRVGILASVNGHKYELDDNEPGYFTFTMHMLYYLGGAPLVDDKGWRGDLEEIDEVGLRTLL